MSHTPGPWVVWGPSSNDGEAEVVSNQDGSKTVCWTADTYNEDEGEGEVTSEDQSNARLIAAAPELLSALKVLFEDWMTLVGKDLKELDEDVSQIWSHCEAVIAKAEGKANV